MRHLIAVVLALALAGMAVPAQAAALAETSTTLTHAQQMAALSPTLRTWVERRAHAIVDGSASPEPAAISRAIRKRLADQAFTDEQVLSLRSLVIREALRVAKAEARATAEELKQLESSTTTTTTSTTFTSGMTVTGTSGGMATGSAVESPTIDPVAKATLQAEMERLLQMAQKLALLTTNAYDAAMSTLSQLR